MCPSQEDESSILSPPIKLWNPQTGALLTTLRGHEDSVWWVSWSPDGRALASESYDKAIKLWKVSLP
ncbi:MAG: hypothetical protein IGQ88_08630 [Gloeomargaritaceae cyanobacterium C42_A2020_066]|nr:hypothetical protein [Gloeomargaritaceae cyanobacterium C42_A2020_066]